jgi:hypothetical protein
MDGRSNHEIRVALRTGAKTVEPHLARIVGRFGLASLTEQATRALREGGLDLPPARGGATRDRADRPARRSGGIIRRVIATLRAMPPGIRIFLGYAFLVLGLIGLSLRWVVDQAIGAPISLPGLVVMVLLAYTIFTTTLVLQRKEAARGLALGLSTLTIPALPLALLAAQPLFALFVGALAILLFTGLTRPAVRAWLNEP